MKFRVKLPDEVQEVVDGVSSFMDLVGKAIGSGTRTVRQAKKTVQKARRAGRAAARVARAGRDAASDIGAAAREAETSVDVASGTVIVDLRGQRGRRKTKGEER